MTMTSKLSLICAIFPFQVWNLSEAIKFYQSHRCVISEWIFQTQLFSFEKGAIPYCPIFKHEYEKLEFCAPFWTSPKHFVQESKDTKGKIQ